MSVGFNTQSDTKVTSLELYVDGKFYSRKVLGSPTQRGVCSFWWDTQRAAKGVHTLLVRVFAGDELITTVSGTGTVGRSLIDAVAPTVRFTNIKSGDVLKGKSNIGIFAADDSGEPPLVSLLVDNVLKLLKNTAPYNYTLDTRTYPDGDHQLKTYAYDVAGNRSDPVVVKVAFANGLKPPVVASLRVDHSLDALPRDETAMPAEPAAAAVPSAVPVGKSKPEAARAADPPAPRSAVVRPVASAPEPKLTPVPASAGHAEPSTAAEPVVALAKPPAELAPLDAPEPRKTAPTDSSAPAEPAVSIPPRDVPTSEEAVASTVTIRAEKPKPTAQAPDLPQEVPGEPVVSETRSVAVHRPTARIRDLQMAYLAPDRADAPARDRGPAVEVPRKPVRAAVSPDVRDAKARIEAGTSFHCRPVPPKSSMARIEKKYVPPSGKVKARDLFEKMGGVLFWDAATHTVTVFLGDMKIEMKIGNRTVLVNGQKMQVAAAPYIANGRTIIGADLYHQACALVEAKEIARR